ncbi:unnamed protein product [Rotaria sp. Silwood2]|nr:unnamed protein product [Rotaria sp. Silwood2]
MDSTDFIASRASYFRKLDEIRQNGTLTFYQDKTWFNSGEEKRTIWIDKQGQGKMRTNQRKEHWRLCDIITGDESWFYHTQIGRRLSNTAWMGRGNPSTTVVRRSKFAPKILFSTFFKSNGPVFIYRVERGQAIDHHFYINDCLRPLVDEIKRQRPSYGTSHIKIHHDNGRPYIHKDVSNYLESEGLTVMPHPPNSSDLSPCDF